MVGFMACFSLAILCSRFKIYSSQENPEGRVVDGQFVKICHFPHAVFLEIIKPERSTHICGSSVVNQHFLLTAAHCFSEEQRRRSKDEIVAYAGHEDLEKTTIVRKTRLPIVHEKYDPEVVENDIALVYLPHKLPLGNSVKRIIIMKYFPRNKKGSLAGWGIINDITNEGTMLLKAVTQTVGNQKVCSSVVSGPGMLCAGSTRASDPRPAA
ncbi:jg8109 [Pararge aegeria aegeria]|uniref:Jg8109 protein n=1 Tax=Pararge aegeria aegeria TaxID=348720 RepID=A0A8S4SJF4_9NEOP|nr:jg8109 [Pararge aegeria aegeria]